MKTGTTILALWICVSSIGLADIIYDFDFESPDFTVDTQITSGSGYGADGSVFVRSGVADFSTQVASLEPAGSLLFGVTPALSSGMVLISWDMALISAQATPPIESIVFSIESLSEGPLLLGYYRNDSTIVVNGQTVASYTLGQQMNFSASFNLDADSFDLVIDGGVVIDDSPLGATESPEGVLFSREFLASPTYAIDNFRWEVVPEPTSALLLILGGSGVYLARRRQQSRL